MAFMKKRKRHVKKVEQKHLLLFFFHFSTLSHLPNKINQNQTLGVSYLEKGFLIYLCGSALKVAHLGSLKISQDLSRGKLKSSRTQRIHYCSHSLNFVSVFIYIFFKLKMKYVLCNHLNDPIIILLLCKCFKIRYRSLKILIF